MKSFTLMAVMAAYASAVALNDLAAEHDIDIAGIVDDITNDLDGDIATGIADSDIGGELKGSEAATGDLAGSSNEDILNTINDTLAKNLDKDEDKHDRS